MDSVRSGPFGQIFRPDNFIFGQVGRYLAHWVLESERPSLRPPVPIALRHAL